MSEPSSRVTMPLLTRITQQSLDEDYQVAAERRLRAAPSLRTPGSRRTAGVVIAVFGVLISTAFIQTTLSEDVDNAGRAALIERITAQRERVDELQATLAELREGNADLAEGLTQYAELEQTARSRQQRVAVRTGFVPVRGPGIRLTLDNDPGADPAQLLQDADLALLANGLWEAGAEAIAVDGQRLTALSSFRNVGVPIEVNGVGIEPPYSVLVIGDAGSLQSRLVDSSSGMKFLGLQQALGFSLEMDNDDQLSLPAGPPRFLNLRSAAAGTSTDRTSPKEEEIEP